MTDDRLLPAALLACLLSAPAAAGAQLRPLDPLDWRALDGGAAVSAELGTGWYADQRLSLAGAEGTLREYGNLHLAWRTGRTLLEVSGTAWRAFDDEAAFAAPVDGTRADAGSRRDAGDVRVATVVRLTPPERPLSLALRFGTRLPTTDNEVGLERDRTDFFALLAGQLRRGPLRVQAESGVGIHGTVDPKFEQADVLLFALGGEYRLAGLTPSLGLLGQRDGFDGFSVRGNEDLVELRLGLRAGERRWVRAEWVHGLTEFSPPAGLVLTVGARR